MTPQNLSEAFRLSVFAKSIGENADTMYRWMRKGVAHRITHERIYLKLTRMPAGWAITRQQYDDFLAKLNEQP